MMAQKGVSAISFRSWYGAQFRREERITARIWGLSALSVALTLGAGLAWGLYTIAPESLQAEEASVEAIAVDVIAEILPSPPSSAPLPPQASAAPAPAAASPPLGLPPSPAPRSAVPVPRHVSPVMKSVTKKDATRLSRRVSQPPGQEPARESSEQSRSSSAASSSSSEVRSSPFTSAHSWQAALLARLEAVKHYPEEAQSDHQEGTTSLHVVMNRQGHVLSVRLSRSSGHKLLDQESLALVRRAEPLPLPPPSIPGDPLAFTVPIAFFLE